MQLQPLQTQSCNKVNFGKLVLPEDVKINSGDFKIIERGLGGKCYPPDGRRSNNYISHFENMLESINEISGKDYVTVRAEAKDPLFSDWPAARFSIYHSNEEGETIGKRIAAATFSEDMVSLHDNLNKKGKILDKLKKAFKSKTF